MRFRYVLIAAALLLPAAVSPAALAQVLDLSAMKCSDFIKRDKDAVASIVLWLDGYYTDEDATPLIDYGKIAAKVEKFSDYCKKNAIKSVSDAAEELLGN